MQWLLGLSAAAGLYVLVLKGLVLSRDAFGRQPPLHVDVIAVEKRVSALEQMMERLATKDELDLKFQALDAKRSADTGTLHKHVESTASNFHKRLNDVSESLGSEIKNLPKDIFEMIRNASMFGKN